MQVSKLRFIIGVLDVEIQFICIYLTYRGLIILFNGLESILTTCNGLRIG